MKIKMNVYKNFWFTSFKSQTLEELYFIYYHKLNLIIPSLFLFFIDILLSIVLDFKSQPLLFHIFVIFNALYFISTFMRLIFMNEKISELEIERKAEYNINKYLK